MATPYNITESALIKTGTGKLRGVIINSHTSGTLKLVDGLYNGAAASGVLTSSGAMVPADYAIGTLTSDATAVADGATVVVGATGGTSITYRAKTTPVQAYDVAIGSTADGSAFLANLKKAINGTGLGDGTDYYAGTAVNPDIVAGALTSTTLVVAFKTIGTGGNAYTTTETSTHLSWGGATLAGGVTAAGATITIGSITYTVTLTLAETLGLTAVPYQVKWVTSEAVFLDNLKAAINGTGLPGTDYGTGTYPHGQVTATTNTNTAQTVVSRTTGTAGNSIATTETLANYAWGAATLASGTGVEGTVICNTITFSDPAVTGERFIPFEEGATFTRGLLAIVGGTADITLLVD